MKRILFFVASFAFSCVHAAEHKTTDSAVMLANLARGTVKNSSRASGITTIKVHALPGYPGATLELQHSIKASCLSNTRKRIYKVTLVYPNDTRIPVTQGQNVLYTVYKRQVAHLRSASSLAVAPLH